MYHFNKLSEKDKKEEEKNNLEYEGIVTEKMPSEMSLGSFTLKEVIDKLPNRALRRIAYSHFVKHPIDQHFKIDREEEFLEKEYFTLIGGDEYNTLYLSYVQAYKGFLFTVAVHNDLKTNSLCLTSRSGGASVFIDNLYGKQSNTEYIVSCIKKINEENLNIFEKIKSELNKPIITTAFGRDFKKLTNEQKESILKGFIEAKERGLTTDFYPDERLIKDVTPKNKSINVFELRVYSSTALRVYFHENPNKVYLVSIGKKSNSDQNKDIKAAYSILKKQFLTH